LVKKKNQLGTVLAGIFIVLVVLLVLGYLVSSVFFG